MQKDSKELIRNVEKKYNQNWNSDKVCCPITSEIRQNLILDAYLRI